MSQGGICSSILREAGVIGPILLLLGGVTFGVLLTRIWLRRNQRRERQALAATALAGEVRAATLLRMEGFEILSDQHPALWWIDIEGEQVEVEVRADYLVEDRETGERFVAEVKTGMRGPDPTHPATRRQLLEYAEVFAPMGVLLVDPEAGTIREIAFPGIDP